MPTEQPLAETMVPATEAQTSTILPEDSVEPTLELSPTLNPRLTYEPASQLACEPAPDQPGAVASGQAIEYACTDTVVISGSDIAPADIDITWYSHAAVGGGWSVQVLPPVKPGDPDPVWTDPGLGEAWIEFRQISPLDTGSDPVAIDQTVTIRYSVRLTRAACAITPQTLSIDRSVAITSADPTTIITAKQVDILPLYIKPELAPIPDPAVSFDGPLHFGEVAVTASGPETSARQGTVSVTVSGMDQTCGAWDLEVHASPLTDGAGNTLQGARLVVVGVNNMQSPGGGCDLTGGCTIASLTGSPDAPASQSIALGVELRVPDQPRLGAFNTSMTAVLIPASAS